MTHASATAKYHWNLDFHVVLAGCACPLPEDQRTAAPKPSNLARLIPLGSVCPAPAEDQAVTSAAHPRSFASSLVPPGSTCPEFSSVSVVSHTEAPEKSSSLGIRLVPAGSTCQVLSDREPSARLSQPTFSDVFLSTNRMPGFPRTVAIAYSMAFQVLLLSAVILVPLWFISSPDLKKFAVTMLVAPLPPAAPPAPLTPPPRVTREQPAPRKTLVQQGKLVLPMAIPKHAETISEAPLPPEIEPNGIAGVYGGLPADLTGIIPAGVAPAPPPPALPSASPAPVISRPKGPLRVGGDVRPPRAISRVEPQYPKLARQARIEGDVVVSATIDPHGDVVEMKAVSGPPMLYPAAMAALRDWKFEPTYLNGEPWPIQYEVTLHFRLSASRLPSD